MSWLRDLLQSPVTDAVLAGLLHTLWIGAVTAAVVNLLLRRLPASRPQLRYAVTLGGLFAVVFFGLVAMAVSERHLHPSPDHVATSDGRASTTIPFDAPGAAPASTTAPRGYEPSGNDAAKAGMPWRELLLSLWFVGVCGMLVRMSVEIGGALRLARPETAIVPAELADTVTSLCQTLAIRRRVRVVLTPLVSSPAVLGILWPTLLLPPALVTGLPVEHLRVVLAHELLHVRRHDYAVQLVQFLVEALLYFNPFVWLLSRQVRLEREACCDAGAAALAIEPVDYARILLAIAERGGVRLPRAAVAATEPSTLRERVTRILRPGYRSSLRLSARGLLLTLAAAGTVLIVLWNGTHSVVELAARALTPRERIAVVSQLEQAHEAAAPKEYLLEGTVRTHDGAPLPARTRGIAGSPGVLKSVSIDLGTGNFSWSLRGESYGIVEAPGYAPALAGPFEPAPQAESVTTTVTLQPGFTGAVRFQDGEGNPVVGVDVKVSLPFPDRRQMTTGSAFLVVERSDDSGLTYLEHAPAWPITLEATASGYATARRESLRLVPGETLVWELEAALATTGVVVDRGSGRPIVGAAIRLVRRDRGAHFRHFGVRGPVLATTNADGAFSLRSLRSDSAYRVVVEAPGHARLPCSGLESGQTNIRFELGPELVVRGRLAGALSTLSRNRQGAGLVFYQQHLSSVQNDGQVEVDEDERTFEIRDVMAGRLRISAGPRSVEMVVSESIEDLVIDLDAQEHAPTVPIPIRFEAPEGSPPPRGMVEVQVYTSDRELSSMKEEEVRDGRLEVQGHVPGRLFLRPRKLPGYWFEEKNFLWDQEEPPVPLRIPVYAAGAVWGRVVDGAGRNAVGVTSVSCYEVNAPEGEIPFRVHNVQTDDDGRFLAASLPLGREYLVVAEVGKYRKPGRPIRLDASRPTAGVTIEIGEGVDLIGQVVGPSGEAVPGVPVHLELLHPIFGTGWSPPARSDADGRFRFQDLNPDWEYKVFLPLRVAYQPTQQEAVPGTETIISLEEGRVVVGRVVDQHGRPVVAADVTASARDPFPRYEAEAPTDAAGRFRFSNLPPAGCDYQVRTERRSQPGKRSATDARGEGELLELQIELFED